MKERIIRESIESLRREGLRFSVDTLAERLNISKKTIYHINHMIIYTIKKMSLLRFMEILSKI